MKTMKCSDMGGPCDEKISANSWEEMKARGMKHLGRAHPEMAEQMKSWNPTDVEKWEAVAKAKFDALPDTQ